MKKVLYPGSFDPFTNGHLDIVNRALNIFDEITILVASPPEKKSFLPVDVRVKLLKEIFASNSAVKIDSWSGLTVDYLRKNNLRTMVRGLRPTGDFEAEFQMASMNRELFDEIDTVFLATGEEYYFVSSSLIREIYSHGGDIKKFVPSVIFNHLKKNKE